MKQMRCAPCERQQHSLIKGDSGLARHRGTKRGAANAMPQAVLNCRTFKKQHFVTQNGSKTQWRLENRHRWPKNLKNRWFSLTLAKKLKRNWQLLIKKLEKHVDSKLA